MPTNLFRSFPPILIAAAIAAGACPAFAGADTASPDNAAPASATKPDDFVGRWIYSPAFASDKAAPERIQLDVVRCGSAFCGIKVSGKGACAEKILSFKDTGDTRAAQDSDEAARFLGTVDWADPAATDKAPAAKYYVTVTVYGPDPTANPDKPKTRFLSMGGYPASDGVPAQYSAREFPFGIDFEFVGPSSCTLPAS